MSDSDLEGLLEAIGVRLGRSTDDEVYGYCPGHLKMLGRSDRRPNTWSVARRSGYHYCFSCEYGGSLIELVMEVGEVDHWNAIKLMRDHGLDPSDPEDLSPSYHERPKRTPPPKFLEETELDDFVDPPAKALRARGLTLDAARHYDVRWDPHDKLWITPIRLFAGPLIGWQAKNDRYFDNYPPKVPKRTTLFGIDVFPKGATAILVESPLDVVRLYAAGFEGGLSSFGVQVSDEQMGLILSVTDEVILALDNDSSGRAVTRRIITGKRLNKTPTTAWGRKLNVSVFNYGGSAAKDPGEMTDDEIEFGIEKAIHSTEWL